MLLSDLAKMVLTGNKELKEEMSRILKVDYQTIGAYVRENKPYNPLTTVAMVNLIADQTGLTQEQILTEKKAA